MEKTCKNIISYANINRICFNVCYFIACKIKNVLKGTKKAWKSPKKLEKAQSLKKPKARGPQKQKARVSGPKPDPKARGLSLARKNTKYDMLGQRDKTSSH